MRINYVDNKEEYRGQFNLTLASFAAELANCVPEFIDALLANSLIVWADFFGSLEVMFHYLLILVTVRQMQKDDGDKYNFGLERLETTVSFICDNVLVVSYLMVILIAVTQLADPTQPTAAIGIFLLLKVFNVAADICFYLKSKKNLKNHPSRLNETETASIEDELIQDVIMGVLAAVCFFFRDYRWSWYVSPAASVILGSVFVFHTVKRIRSEFGEITDVSASVEDQDKMFDILLDYRSSIKKIKEVNCHFLNHRLMIDINVSFKDDFTYDQQVKLLNDIAAEAKKAFGSAEVRFVIETDL